MADPYFGSGGVSTFPVSSDPRQGGVLLRDQTTFVVAGEVPGPNTPGLWRLSGPSISDYANLGGGGVTDWSSGGSTNMFGACLRDLTGGSAVAAWVEDANTDCTAVDTDPWNALPATPASPGSKIAGTSSTSATDSVVRLRFGMRAPAAWRPRTYLAGLTFEVVAPNA